jgi:hypothetical protein
VGIEPSSETRDMADIRFESVLLSLSSPIANQFNRLLAENIAKCLTFSEGRDDFLFPYRSTHSCHRLSERHRHRVPLKMLQENIKVSGRVQEISKALEPQ